MKIEMSQCYAFNSGYEHANLEKIAGKNYPMGMALVDESGEVELYGSDRPEMHVREAQYMNDVLQNYLSSEEGTSFLEYLGSKGKEAQIDKVGAGDFKNLEDSIIAATIYSGSERFIVGNYEGDKGFEERVTELTSLYQEDFDVSEDDLREYVLAHEIAHSAGYKSEASVEKVLTKYFAKMEKEAEDDDIRDKYQALKEIAQQRAQEAN
jgi:hypothetical protein